MVGKRLNFRRKVPFYQTNKSLIHIVLNLSLSIDMEKNNNSYQKRSYQWYQFKINYCSRYFIFKASNSFR